MSGLVGRCKCGHLLKEWRGNLMPHECPLPRVPLVRASDAPRACRDCDRAAGHPGVCTDDGLTPWAGGGGRLTVWGIIRTVCASPLGAMWGIALLVLLWLSGCA